MQQQQQARAPIINMQLNLGKIDNDCQNIISQLTKKSPVQLESNIYYFISENLNLCNKLISKLDFKTCYYVYKKIEKLLIEILKGLISENNESYPILKLLHIILNEESFPSQEVLFCGLDKLVPDRNKIKHKQMNYVLFLDKICRFITIIFNNISAIYSLRGKTQQAFNTLLKVFQFRTTIINSQLSIFQLAGIATNMAYCLSLMPDQTSYQSTSFGKTASILFLSPAFQNAPLKNSSLLVEKSTDFLIILELKIFKCQYNQRLIANKTATSYVDKYSCVMEKIYSLLESIYYFLHEVFTKEGNVSEAKQAEENAEKIINLLSEVQITQQNIQQKPGQQQKQQQQLPKQNPIYIQQQQQKQQQQLPEKDENLVQLDSLSQASMQSVDNSSVFSQSQSQLLQKDNIIFQKYIEINQMKYKIIFVQIPEYNCVQILLYCKPKQFLKKIIIGFQSIIDYASQIDQTALSDEEALNSLLKFFYIQNLKRIAKKLYVRNGELFIKEIEFYRSVDDFLKFNQKQQPTKI